MEEARITAPNVFMTFGLGALLVLSLLFPLPVTTSLQGFGSIPEEISGLDELWIPITATLVFATHSMGSILIFLGSYAVTKFSKSHDAAEQCFYRLLEESNERLWTLVIENRRSIRLMHGLFGIFLIHVFVAALSTVRWLTGEDSRMLYDLSFLIIVFSGLMCAFLGSSALNIRLILLEGYSERHRLTREINRIHTEVIEIEKPSSDEANAK